MILDYINGEIYIKQESEYNKQFAFQFAELTLKNDSCYLSTNDDDFSEFLCKTYYESYELCEKSAGFCLYHATNKVDGFLYKNIKISDSLRGRSVKIKLNKMGNILSVIKREPSCYEHSWLRVNLMNEIDNYQLLSNKYDFIPKLYDYNREGKWMEIEHVSKNTDRGSSIECIVMSLKDNGLYIADTNPYNLVKTKTGFIMVDLEGIIPYNNRMDYIKYENRKQRMLDHENQILKLKVFHP